MTDRFQECDGAWDGEDRDPSSFGELRDNNDYESDRRCGRADRVDPEMRMMCCVSALRLLLADHPPPVNGHAGLREREGQERADCKERD